MAESEFYSLVVIGINDKRFGERVDFILIRFNSNWYFENPVFLRNKTLEGIIGFLTRQNKHHGGIYNTRKGGNGSIVSQGIKCIRYSWVHNKLDELAHSKFNYSLLNCI